MKKVYYVFDVDGTITPTRSKMEEDFVPKFIEFCKHNNVTIVSGSTESMIFEQLPETIIKSTKLYTCSGIEGCIIDVDYEITVLEELIKFLEILVQRSRFPYKAGYHIDIRKGMVNFSIPGRNANMEQRKAFVSWNKDNKEAEFFKTLLEEKFPELEHRLGGETSIDITNKGINKSLVGKDILTFDPNAFIIFYGNQILDGNDYPLAKFIDENKCGYSVQINYKDLKKIL